MIAAVMSRMGTPVVQWRGVNALLRPPTPRMHNRHSEPEFIFLKNSFLSIREEWTRGKLFGNETFSVNLIIQ